MIWKYCRPWRNMLHSITARAMANSSSSMTTYLNSAGVRKWEPACTIDHCSVPPCCSKMKPSLCLLASVHSLVGWSRLKYANVGTSVRCSFALMNASWCSTDHKKSFFVLERGLIVAIMFVLDKGHFKRPIKERRSEWLEEQETGYSISD